MPETRETILAHIIAWIEEQAQSSLENKHILWLYGPAGAGKSAIAQKIAELFLERSLKIVASFFFTRGKCNRGMIAYFVTTIAYQMTVSIPEMRDDIGKVVAQNPAILRQSLELQIQRLIVEPFHSFLSRPQPLPLPQKQYLVVVDGLDECDGDENQKLIISHISALIHKHNLPLTFLIASRPEPHIVDSFRKDPRLPAITTEFKLDPSSKDIRTFLLDSFRMMKPKHPSLIALTVPWPTNSDIDKLVYRSSGYFIYASTIIQFIDDKDMLPAAALELVLSAAPTPFSTFDALYTQILSTVPQHNRPYLMAIFEINRAVYPKLKLKDLEQLLQLPTGGIHVILQRLHSLLNIHEPTISPHHASFYDYLHNKERSGIFYADKRLGQVKFIKAIVKDLRIGSKLPFVHNFEENFFAASHLLNQDPQFLEDLKAVSMDSWQHSGVNVIGILSLTFDNWIEGFMVI